MSRRSSQAWLSIVVLSVSLANPITESAAQVQLGPDVYIPSPPKPTWWNTVGITFAGDKFVLSLNTNGYPLSSISVRARGFQDFAPTLKLTGGTPETIFEHPIASSLGLGGFPCRDIYVGAGNKILHITSNGERSNTFFIGLDGVARVLLFDAIGTFEHNLIVATQTGSVYAIDGQGESKLLATIGEDIKGMDIVPLATGFGPYDSHLVVLSPMSGLIRSISASGTVTVLNETHRLLGGEALFIVPPDLGKAPGELEGLYQINLPLDILRAGVDELWPYRGDGLAASQIGRRFKFWQIHWSGSGFRFTPIFNISPSVIGMTLVTPAMINPGGSCSTNSSPTTSSSFLN
jgi:hypothetical protein